MEQLWKDWIQLNVNLDEYNNEIYTIVEYFEHIFGSVLLRECVRRKIKLLYNKDKLVEKALNTFFFIWVAYKKNKNHPYIYNFSINNDIYLNKNSHILEYLEQYLFNNHFWIFLIKSCGFGIFNPEKSDFARIFWEHVPEFLYGVINIEDSKCFNTIFSGSSEFTEGIRDNNISAEHLKYDMDSYAIDDQ